MSNTIAITVTGVGGLEQPMDERFGRAPVFLLVDPKTGEVEASLENAAVTAAHGAGTGAAALMSKHGVKGVISGRFGPKAYQALAAMKIEMWTTGPGLTAGEALEKYRDGSLTLSVVKEFR